MKPALNFLNSSIVVKPIQKEYGVIRSASNGLIINLNLSIIYLVKCFGLKISPDWNTNNGLFGDN